MKLEIESPTSRHTTPTCASDRGLHSASPWCANTREIYEPLRHRAIVRARRRRRGLEGRWRFPHESLATDGTPMEHRFRKEILHQKSAFNPCFIRG